MLGLYQIFRGVRGKLTATAADRRITWETDVVTNLLETIPKVTNVLMRGYNISSSFQAVTYRDHQRNAIQKLV